MSNQSDFNELEAFIKAVDKKDVKHPNMPIGINMQEAEDLVIWLEPDRPKLVGAGLPEATIDGLSKRIGAVRYIQSRWNSKRFTKEEAQKKFALLGPEAYDLCERIIHSMLFAYRKLPDIKSRVQAIAEGTGDADMIQDLSDLSVHGKNNPEPLLAINFDITQLDQAASKSDELGSLLGIAHGEKATDSETKIMRDKAYTYLKQSVDEIREYGRFLFWRDETRATGYASAYHRQERKSQKKETTPAYTEAP